MKPNLVLVFVFAFIVKCQLSFAQAPDIAIDPNLTFNGEQSMAINPSNPSHIVVAWMKYHFFPAPAGMVIAVANSTNGGLNWSTPVEIPHFRPHWVSADPTLAFHSDGTLFLGFIDYKITKDSGAVFVTKSINGGASWGSINKAVDVHDNPDLIIDRPWLAIDNSGGTYDGRLYLATMSIKEDPLPHHLFCCNSNDGITWTTPIQVDNTILAGPSIQPMGIPAVTKNGKLIIAYFSYNPPQSLYPRFVAGISTDGGATISNSVMLTYTNAITITNDTLLQYSYNLSANPNNANNLVFAFIDKSGTDYDLNTLNTQDEGMTWSAPVKINTDPLNNGNNQDMLWANFSTTGKYGATWRDRRANSGAQNQPYKIWGTISSDGGQTFTSEFQLSQTDGPLMIPVDGNDFLGCVLNDTCIYTCWTDKRNNNTNQLFFNKKNFNTVTSNIENQENLFDITVYPNPNKGTIKIKTSTSGEFKLTIKDSNGKELLTDTFKGDNYKLKENLESGIYFITIESNKHKKTVKTVLNK